MRIILIGPPGAGKGTQAQWICKAYSIPLISTGNMLREEIIKSSAIGLKIAPLLKQGKLISDDLIIDLIQQRISQSDCHAGFLLDGFPRTLVQAQKLKEDHIHIDGVFEIFVPDDLLIKRLSGRRIHLPSGRTYNIYHNPPKVANEDDVTKEPLTQRDDDVEETIKKRLAVYHEETQPLLDYYKKWSSSMESIAPKFFSISGHTSIASVREQITTCLKKLNNEFVGT